MHPPIGNWLAEDETAANERHEVVLGVVSHLREEVSGHLGWVINQQEHYRTDAWGNIVTALSSTEGVLKSVEGTCQKLFAAIANAESSHEQFLQRMEELELSEYDRAWNTRWNELTRMIEGTFPSGVMRVTMPSSSPWQSLGGGIPTIDRWQREQGYNNRQADDIYGGLIRNAREMALSRANKSRQEGSPGMPETGGVDEARESARNVQMGELTNAYEGLLQTIQSAVRNPKQCLLRVRESLFVGDKRKISYLEKREIDRLDDYVQYFRKRLPVGLEQITNYLDERILEDYKGIIRQLAVEQVDTTCLGIMQEVLDELRDTLNSTEVYPEGVGVRGLGNQVRKKRSAGLGEASAPEQQESVAEYPKEITLFNEALGKLGLAGEEPTRIVRNVVNESQGAVLIIDGMNSGAKRTAFRGRKDVGYEDAKLRYVAGRIATAKNATEAMKGLDMVADVDKERYGYAIYVAPKEISANARRVYFMHVSINESIRMAEENQDAASLEMFAELKKQGVMSIVVHVGSCNKHSQRDLLREFTGLGKRRLKQTGVGS